MHPNAARRHEGRLAPGHGTHIVHPTGLSFFCPWSPPGALLKWRDAAGAQESSLRLLPRITAFPERTCVRWKWVWPGHQSDCRILEIQNEYFSILIRCWVVKAKGVLSRCCEVGFFARRSWLESIVTERLVVSAYTSQAPWGYLSSEYRGRGGGFEVRTWKYLTLEYLKWVVLHYSFTMVNGELVMALQPSTSSTFSFH